MSENGNYVSRAELKAHLDPMRSDIAEIKSDVKNLILASTAERAVSVEERVVAAEAKDRGARRIALVSLAAALMGSLWWVNDAIAKLAH